MEIYISHIQSLSNTEMCLGSDDFKTPLKFSEEDVFGIPKILEFFVY